MLKLTITSRWRVVMIAGLAIALAACEKPSTGEKPEPPASTPPEIAPTAAVRGTFGVGSCESSQRVPVPANAAFAMYYDNDGNEIATAPVEILAGTEGNQMCPVADEEGGPEPGFCTPLCTKKIGGRNVCVECP